MSGEEHPEQTLSIEEMVGRFEALFEKVRAATREVRLNPQDPQELSAAALHGTLLELARGITELIKVGDATGPPLLFRTMLEAYVDLKNLVGDADYLCNMRAAWLGHKRRLGERAKAGNPYLESIVADPERDTTIAALDAELKTLADNGYKPLRVQERFERAGESDRYFSVYWHLCTHSHNNFNSLQNRHVEETPAGLRLVCFRPITPDAAQRYLDQSAGIIANSIAFVKGLVEGVVENLGPTERALNHLRALYPDSESGSAKADPR